MFSGALDRAEELCPGERGSCCGAPEVISGFLVVHAAQVPCGDGVQSVDTRDGEVFFAFFKLVQLKVGSACELNSLSCLKRDGVHRLIHVGYPRFCVSQARVFVVLGVCRGIVCTTEVCVVFLDTLTPVFELELRPESLKVLGMDLQLCGLQVWCWLVSTILWLVIVERQLDLLSVSARLRGVEVDLYFVEVMWCDLPLVVSYPSSGESDGDYHTHEEGDEEVQE
ncbi:hypothetical protein Taro_032595 [Colocasia esculenta]|uniref:Uncharacterized protein n=1 Tax=Colocasia esculenta TaxID=4460 RepID=A0A843VVB9_COLES|nr:hypothetical protein [Colocasia esculenta]